MGKSMALVSLTTLHLPIFFPPLCRPGMTGDQLYLGNAVHTPHVVNVQHRALAASAATLNVTVTMTVPKETKSNASAAVEPGGNDACRHAGPWVSEET